MKLVSTVAVLDGADGWRREEHHPSLNPPPDIIRRPDAWTVLEPPAEPSLKAPRPLRVAFRFPALAPVLLGLRGRSGSRERRDQKRPGDELPSCVHRSYPPPEPPPQPGPRAWHAMGDRSSYPTPTVCRRVSAGGPEGRYGAAARLSAGGSPPDRGGSPPAHEVPQVEAVCVLTFRRPGSCRSPVCLELPIRAARERGRGPRAKPGRGVRSLYTSARPTAFRPHPARAAPAWGGGGRKCGRAHEGCGVRSTGGEARVRPKTDCGLSSVHRSARSIVAGVHWVPVRRFRERDGQDRGAGEGAGCLAGPAWDCPLRSQRGRQNPHRLRLR